MDGFFFSVDSIFVGFFGSEFFAVLPERDLRQDDEADEQVGLLGGHVLTANDDVLH